MHYRCEHINPPLPSKKIPPRSLVVDSPGKVVRELNESDLAMIQLSIDSYVQKGSEFHEIFPDQEQNH